MCKKYTLARFLWYVCHHTSWFFYKKDVFYIYKVIKVTF